MENFRFTTRSKPSNALLRVSIKLSEIGCQVQDYGTGIPLYNSEIHMIKAIEENPGIHVFGLAELLGITKGAVSQTLTKLAKKGMVVKEADPEKLSRLRLTVTNLGRIAYENHQKSHEQLDERFDKALRGATKEEKAFLARFLKDFEKELDGYADELEKTADAEKDTGVDRIIDSGKVISR